MRLTNGIKFPRVFKDAAQTSVADTTFGPVEIPSLIRENVKFMDVSTLADLATDPGKSQKVQAVLQEIKRRQEEQVYLEGRRDEVNRDVSSDGRWCVIPGISGADAKDYRFGGPNAKAEMVKGEVVISVPGSDEASRPVQMEEMYSKWTPTVTAREIHISAKPNTLTKTMGLSIELYDATLLGRAEGPGERGRVSRSFDTPMPPAVVDIGNRKLDDFMHDPDLTKRLSRQDAFDLNHEQLVARNAVHSELHGRASLL